MTVLAIWSGGLDEPDSGIDMLSTEGIRGCCALLGSTAPPPLLPTIPVLPIKSAVRRTLAMPAPSGYAYTLRCNGLDNCFGKVQ